MLVYIDVPDTPEKSTVIPLFDYLNGEKGADTYSISNTWHFLESRRTETGKGRHVANWFGYNMSPRSFDIVVVGFGPGLDPTDLLTMVGKRDTSLGVLLSAAINSNAIAVCSPDQYKTVLTELETKGGISPEVRQKFAGRALRYMARLYKMLAGTILQTNSDSNG